MASPRWDFKRKGGWKKKSMTEFAYCIMSVNTLKRKSLTIPGFPVGRKLLGIRALCVSASRLLCQGCVLGLSMEGPGKRVTQGIASQSEIERTVLTTVEKPFFTACFWEKKICHLSLAFQIKTRADPDEARTAVQREGSGDPARVSGLW